MNNLLIEATQSNLEIDDLIKGFIAEFELTERPIEVSFRALLPELKNNDRFAHLIHSYPAKLLVHIPYFFLNNTIFSQPGDTVLDPFCGTGTVLLEALLAGRNALGSDANPLARLIATVKTTNNYSAELYTSLGEIISGISRSTDLSDFPSVVNIDYWFSEKNKKGLGIILNQINEITNVSVKNFFLICFSNLIKKVSFADPRVSVPVKLNKNRFAEGSTSFLKVEKRLVDLENIDVVEKFEFICKENIGRVKEQELYLTDYGNFCHAEIISNDARHLTKTLNSSDKLENESVALIITSPPYAGAQKYIRSSSLNLGWLGLANVNDLKALDNLNIGKENYTKSECNVELTNIQACDELVGKIKEINPLRAQIVSKYIIEMQKALIESIRVLKPAGYMVLIVGNNKVCNYEFNTQQYLTEFVTKKGLKLVFKLIDDIKSYGLMTKRNKTADIISREWVLVFQKQ